MAELPNVFKESDHGGMGFDPIPDIDEDGKKVNYLVQLIKSEMKDNKNTEGQNLALQFKVQDGKYKGRLLFTRLNLVNKNATAVEIAQRELADICRACGKGSIKDSTELHNADLFVQVKIIPEDEVNPAKNEISKYIAYADGQGGADPFAE